MVSSSQRLHTELSQWAGAQVVVESARAESGCDALEQACGYGLPDSYRQILIGMNGTSFGNLELYSAQQVLTEWHAFQQMLTSHYREDPDWPDGQGSPRFLIPIGVGMDERLRVLDAGVQGGEVLLWEEDERELITIHRTVESWLWTELLQLAVHYDPSGRPKPLRGGDTTEKPRRVILAHLEQEPTNAYAHLLLAHWHARHSPPEEALFAYRTAAECRPCWPVTQYYCARWAILQDRPDEARQWLRRAVASPVGQNPRKNGFRAGYRPAAHRILAELYDDVDQHRKALEQRRACQEAIQRYGFGGYDESDEFLALLKILER